MTAGETLRVAIDVTPRLFRDALSRVLADNDIDVVVVPDDDRDRVALDCDVVVTTPGVAAPVSAHTLIEVAPGSGDVTARRTASDDAALSVSDLDQLMSVLRRFAGDDAG